MTDQGELAIESITDENTINGNKVVGITKQTTKHKIVLIKPNALGLNCPSKKTYVTKDHGIYLNGSMIKAGKLVDGDKVVAVDIGQHNIYNILLKTHAKVVVNNMEAETLNIGATIL
jgi:hypothetical protein